MARRASSFRPPYLRTVRVDPARLAGRTRYPFHLPLVQRLDLGFARPITVLVGDNGSGKSTLLEAVAELAGFPPDGGSRHHGLGSVVGDRRLAEELEAEETGRAGRLAELRSEGKLADVLVASWLPRVHDGFFFRAETFAGLARWLDDTSLDARGAAPAFYLRASHAEGFLRFFRERVASATRSGRPCLFVLDEPEAALTPRRQLELMHLLVEVAESGKGQVILATHSPVLMACPGAELWTLGDGQVRIGRLEEIEHFQVLAAFAADPYGYVARGLAALDEPDPAG